MIQVLMGASSGQNAKNRRLGWALAALIVIYIGAIIAFIIAY